MFLNMSAITCYAENKTFTKDYTYQASEDDSKSSCRANALVQVKRLLLEEIGVYIESRTKVSNLQLTQDDISSATSGIVKTEVLDESWDGKQCWIKAKMSVDPVSVIDSVEKAKRGKTLKVGSRSIERGREYRILFNTATIEPGDYSKDDSNPAPDAYITVKDEHGSVLFNSGNAYVDQSNLKTLMNNRNNYTPNFHGIGFKHTFLSNCIAVNLMDWDGCEGLMCSASSKDDIIGADFRICVGDKSGKRLIEAHGWRMNIEIIPNQ